MKKENEEKKPYTGQRISDKVQIEEKEKKKTLAPMGKIEQIRNAHRTMQINFKKEGRETMKQKERAKWRKKLQKKLGYKNDNDLW